MQNYAISLPNATLKYQGFVARKQTVQSMELRRCCYKDYFDSRKVTKSILDVSPGDQARKAIVSFHFNDICISCSIWNKQQFKFKQLEYFAKNGLSDSHKPDCIASTPSAGTWYTNQRWADCEIFQSESNPDSQKLNPIQYWSAKFLKAISLIQSWSAHIKPCIWFRLVRQNRHNLMRQNRHILSAFPKFNKAVLMLPSEVEALLELFAIRLTQLVELVKC